MRIQYLIRISSGLVLSLALLGMAACHESEGTKRIPGTYPPESEIDRKKPAASGNAGNGADASGTADTDAAGTGGAAGTDTAGTAGADAEAAGSGGTSGKDAG